MRYTLPGSPAPRTWMPHATIVRAVLGMLSAVVCTTPSALAQAPGSIVGWGSQVVGVDLGSGFVQVAAGAQHSLGLKADGSVVAWGNDDYGQVVVPAPNTEFVAVAAGGYHSLGLKADGSIVAWGDGRDGQTAVPTSNTDFVAIAAGEYHSLAMKRDGSIIAWGGGGQTTVPLPNAGFIAIAAGHRHSMGLKADGSIVAWGENYYGQTIVPAPNAAFVSVAAGGDHSLGLKADGAVVVWGYNPGNLANVPEPNTGFVAVAAGGDHSMGLKSDGSIVAWGFNYNNQLTVPAPNTGFVAVAAGGEQSLGLKADGSIIAWGDCAVIPTPNAGFTALATGYLHSVGLRADGSVVAWGDNDYGQTAVPTPNTGFVAVAAGGYHSLGLKSDGSIVAWGDPGYGESAVPVPNIGFVAVAAGGHHSLGLKADGSIVAWGAGGQGQSGGDHYGQSVVPVPNAEFVGVAAGEWHSVGLKSDGSVVVWGDGSQNQNITPPSPGFIAIAAGYFQSLGIRADGSIVPWGTSAGPSLSDMGFVAAAVGEQHGVGLKADGSIVAWGINTYGQTDVPTPNTRYSAIAAGRSTSLAIRGNLLPSLTVAPLILNVPSSPGWTSFTVSSTLAVPMSWTVSSALANWLQITSIPAGTGFGRVHVAYQGNLDPTSRSGVIRVYSPTATPDHVDVMIAQAAAQVAPQIIFRDPLPDAVSVPIDGPIRVGFDSDLDPRTVNTRSVGLEYLSIQTSGPPTDATRRWDCGVAYDAPTRTILVTPTAYLLSGLQYTVVVSGLVRGANARSIVPASWSFTPQQTPEREAFIRLLEGFRDTGKASLGIQRDFAAFWIDYGLDELLRHQWAKTASAVLGFLSGVFTGGVTLAGPGARIANDWRHIYATYIKPVDDTHVLEVLDLQRIGQLWHDNAKELQTLGLGGSSSVGACQTMLDHRLAIEDLASPAPRRWTGVESVLAEYDSTIFQTVLTLPPMLDAANAHDAAAYLLRQQDVLRQAGDDELSAKWKLIINGTTRLVKIPLGQVFTVKSQLAAAVPILQADSASTVQMALLVTGLSVFKVGAALTGVGAVFVLGADLAQWGITIADLADSVGEEWEEATDPAHVTPVEGVWIALHTLMQALATDASWGLSFFRSSVNEAVAIASAPARSLRQQAGHGCRVDLVTLVGVPLVCDINLDVASSGRAVFRLRNDGAESVGVSMSATIMLPTSSSVNATLGIVGRGQVTMLAPAEERDLDFPYGAPRSVLLSREGYVLRTTIDILDQNDNVLETLGPIENRFRVGTAAELGLLGQVTEELASTGTLAAGVEQSHWVFLPGGLQAVKWRLSRGDDVRLDLHVYDPTGRHTGFDYEADATESGIPGSSYAGLDSYPQVVQLVSPMAGTYQLRVVAREGAGDYSIYQSGIPPLPATLTLTARTAKFDLRCTDRQTIPLGIVESGGSFGVDSVQALVGDLQGPGDAQIPAASIQVECVSSPILPGTARTFRVTVIAPPGIPPGSYLGVLTVEGRAVGDASNVSASMTLIVNLPFGDSDADHDVDLADIAWFQNCFGQAVASMECSRFDAETNGQIGAGDYPTVVGAVCGPELSPVP